MNNNERNRILAYGSPAEKLGMIRNAIEGAVALALARGDTQSARTLVREVAFLLRHAQSCLSDVSQVLGGDDEEVLDPIERASEIAGDMHDVLMNLPDWVEIVCAALGDPRAKKRVAERRSPVSG